MEMSERKQAKIYTAEFKESAVKVAVESGRPMSQTARELGLSNEQLSQIDIATLADSANSNGPPSNSWYPKFPGKLTVNLPKSPKKSGNIKKLAANLKAY